MSGAVSALQELASLPGGDVLSILSVKEDVPLKVAHNLINLGETDEALKVLNRVLESGDFDHFHYLMILGHWHLRQKRWQEALERYESAMSFYNMDYAAHYFKGFCLHKMGRFEEAIQCYENSLKLNQNFASAWVRLGHCNIMTGRYSSALATYEYAAVRFPDFSEARCGYGTGLSMWGHDQGAETEYRKALALDPKMTEAEMGLGFTMLRAGKWPEGWKHRNATLRHPPFDAPWNATPYEMWDGDKEELRGKRVVLVSEQGYGDTFHFGRYIPLVQELAGEVVIVTEPSLVSIMEMFGCEVVERLQPFPHYDIRTTLMVLPWTFRTSLENVPPAFKFPVTPRHVGARIGLCRHGGARPHDPAANNDDKRRSVAEDVFAPLTEVAPYISLQEDDLKEWGITDWKGTAEIIAGLDLVITVDTAVAHLAGSLGVPTWLLGRANGCFRWLNSGTTTPWYPNMRIYRQPVIGEWSTTIAQVVADLRAWNDARS